jgi:adenylate cyclase
MSEGRVERRLAAILAADVAGYSRLVGADEEGTLSALRAMRREIIDPTIAEHRGRIVKTTGDGLLAEFASVVDALRCAVRWQATVPPESRIAWRVGINVGDVVVEDGDIFGDGVNVAARLEALAEPGGICVSARVQEDAAGRFDLQFEDLGEQSLKNIARPVRVYRVASPKCSDPPSAQEGPRISPAVAAATAPPPALPDKPSIAVLPFQNISGDPEQEHFGDGIAEDVTTALARSRLLFVVARNSAFAFRHHNADVTEIGRCLGARYILEGSVRRAADTVRVTAQLIDAVSGTHLWADRMDRQLTDIFSLQDEIAARVATAVLPAVARTERELAMRKPPENLGAWENYHRGLWHWLKFDAVENQCAQTFLRRSLELDAGFAAAHAALGLTAIADAFLFYTADRDPHVVSAERHARAAIELDPLDGSARATLALALLISGRHGLAIVEAASAVALNENDAWAFGVQGAVLAFGGRPEERCLRWRRRFGSARSTR